MKKRTLLILLVSVFIVGTVMAASARDRLNSGEVLMPGQHLISQNRIYTFSVQRDGNLILRKAESLKSKKKHILWNSGTSGNVTKLFMQKDGNLVLYDNANPKWYTKTNGHPGAYFVLQNDGNAVVYSKDNKPIWSTNTAQ
jgi:hypothetical protein